jgi:CHAT domain-containing protein/Tfp pilus assembly protein PilF
VVYTDIQQKARHSDLDAALQEADQAFRNYSRKDTQWAWRFRILKAHLLVLRGSNEEALALLREDLPPALANTEIAARRSMVRGLASDYSRHYDDAEQYFADAQTLAQRYAPQLLGDIVMARGTLEMDEHKYERAESDFRQALSLAREQKLPFREAQVLGNLGVLATKQEHYDESVDWYRQALDASRSLGAKGSEAKTLGNMGWNYFEMGDVENALEVTKQAEQAASRAGLTGDRAYWLSNLGDYYFAQGDYRSAESALQQAFALAQSPNDERTATQCLNDLSLVALATGQTDEAEKYAKKALDLERAVADRPGALYSLDVEGTVEAAKRHFPQSEQLFQEVIRDPLSGTSLRWEAQARLGEVYAAVGQWQKAERAFLQSIATVETARSSLKTEEFRLSFLSTPITVYSDYIDFLVGQGRSADALQVAELSRARTLADGLGFSSASLSFPIRGFQPSATAKKLDATILSYWLGTTHSYLWVVTPHRVGLIRLAPASEVDSLVLSYRQALVGFRDVLETANAAGQKLYELLVAPAASQIPNGSRVMVIPDGSLYQLNFETLLVPKPALHYLIADATIAKANSLVLLGASTQRRVAQSTKKLFLVGDPVPASNDFPKLQQAESELTQIENYFPASDRVVISGAAATPQSYMDGHPGDFSFVHFVAHGIASRASPLDSAVILTKQGDSYKLYARDIVKQSLRADLVTISACHGAGERTYAGEGLVGLTWAFLRAGAHEVISALWEVDDNSTTQLMTQLYAGLSRGAPPESALRDAKLALLHSRSVYKKPFYWAPFEIYRGP